MLFLLYCERYVERNILMYIERKEKAPKWLVQSDERAVD